MLTEVLSYFDTQNDVDISLVEVGDCTQGQMQVIQARLLLFKDFKLNNSQEEPYVSISFALQVNTSELSVFLIKL